jgi:hypothetical protein
MTEIMGGMIVAAALTVAVLQVVILIRSRSSWVPCRMIVSSTSGDRIPVLECTWRVPVLILSGDDKSS